MMPAGGVLAATVPVMAGVPVLLVNTPTPPTPVTVGAVVTVRLMALEALLATPFTVSVTLMV